MDIQTQIQWKTLDGFPNYKISSEGRIFNTKTKKFLNPAYATNGYTEIYLCNSSKPKKFKTHRLIASLFMDNEFNKREVNHINGIKDDNRLCNLEWATSSENKLHAYKTGLMPNRILTYSKVAEIRKKLKSGIKNVTLSEEYNVSVQWISLIKNNRRYII